MGSSARWPVLALLENLLRCSVTVGLGPIASPVARFTDNGRYWRCCRSQVNTVKGSCWPGCMVRPCVARGFAAFEGGVLHQCIRPLSGAIWCSGPPWISARVRTF